MSPFVRVETEHCADMLDVASNVTQTYVDSKAAMASALSAQVKGVLRRIG